MSYLYEARQQQPNPPESNGMQSQQHPDMAQLPPTREAVCVASPSCNVAQLQISVPPV